MNWLTDYVKPKISSLVNRKEPPSDLWTKCGCGERTLYVSDLKENLNYQFYLIEVEVLLILFYSLLIFEDCWLAYTASAHPRSNPKVARFIIALKP